MAHNPFDNAFSLMQELQGQIHELREALNLERQERANETASLRAALEQEKGDRTTICQQLNHNCDNSVQKVSAAQDRIRFDMGEVREQLTSQTQQSATERQRLKDDMAQATARLDSQVNGLQAHIDQQVNKLTADLNTSNQEWKAATDSFDTKLNETKDDFTSRTGQVSSDLEHFKLATNTMQLGVSQGIGVITQTLQHFGGSVTEKSMESRPTTAGTPTVNSRPGQ